MFDKIFRHSKSAAGCTCAPKASDVLKVLEPGEKLCATPGASQAIRQRFQAAGIPFSANSNISEHLLPGEREVIEKEVLLAAQNLLHALVIDTEEDHNTRETAKRIAKMFVREVFAGRYEPRPRMTEFPNATNADELYVVGPVDVRSACSHHFCPIEGKAWFGCVPGDALIGLSKFSRIARWIMSRPQIQEEATMQLADELERVMKPRALAVVVTAKHSCMTWRGVQESESVMTTSVMRGLFRDAPASRAEVLALMNKRGFECR